MSEQSDSALDIRSEIDQRIRIFPNGFGHLGKLRTSLKTDLD
jgi:hypothetical protein